MNSFGAYLTKEWRELVRTRRLLVFGVFTLFFAFLDPATTLLAPMILDLTMPGAFSADLFSATQLAAVSSYAGDLFEIGVIVAGFSMMGLAARELREKTYVIPWVGGLDPWGFLGAKIVVNGGALAGCVLLTMPFSWVYSALLLPGTEAAGFGFTMAAAACLGLLCFFFAALAVFFGAWLKSGALAGILTIFAAYAGGIVAFLFPDAADFVPQRLLLFGGAGYDGLIFGIFVTAALIAALYILSVLAWRRAVRQ